MKKMLSLLAAAALTASLAGCGASKSYASASRPAIAETAEGAYGVSDDLDAGFNGSGESAVLPEASSARKIIYTSQLDVETRDFDSSHTLLRSTATELGGYLESSTVGSGGRGYRWADYTVRVPSAQFQGFLDQAGGLAHVTWQNTEQQNITETYYDTDGRLKTQQIKLERLQKLLAQAENMEDIITIESAISETEWNIENLSGTLRHYDALVDFATVTVSLQEVYKYSDTEELPENFGQRIGNALSRGWRSFVDGMADFIVALAYNWMWIVLWAAVIIAAAVIVGKIRRRRRAAKNLPAAEKTDEKPGDKSGNS